LDANILLDFYRFGSDDLAEVRKILTLIDDKELELYSNSLLCDEVNRGREAEIASSFNAFRSQKFAVRVPNYGSDLKELELLHENLKSANKAHEVIVAILTNKISSNTLDADVLIEELFSRSIDLEVGDDILKKARNRQLLNNPPRKKGDSLGDSLHWETLLSAAHGYNFHLVSRDADFASELVPGTIKNFLKKDWMAAHGKFADMHLHSSLSEFFQRKFPQIKLSDETEKAQLIEQLSSSGNFATTHGIIDRLRQFEYFTSGQVVRLFSVLVNNSQVGWIATDPDLQDFYIRLKDQAYLVPDELHNDLIKLLEIKDEHFFDPF